MVRLLPRFAASAVAVLALLAGACSTTTNPGEDPQLAVSEAEQEPIDGLIADAIDLDGKEVWVGSVTGDDEDTTSTVLGQITLQALEAAGATVVDRTDAGGTFLLRDSLLSGEIDLYWEGGGLIWTGFLRGPEEGLDAETLMQSLRVRDAEEHGVIWLTPASFEIGRAFAVGDGVLAEGDFATIGELAEHIDSGDEEPTLCVTTRFMNAGTDGRLEFEEVLDVDLPPSVREYDPEPIYPDTADGTCAVGVVQRTSGRIDQYGLETLEDDVGLFLPNPAAPAVRQDVLEEIPELGPLMARIAPRLTASAIQAMNRSVLVDGLTPEEVAANWLRDEGLVAD